MANIAMQTIENDSRGNVDGGIIQAVVDMLPKNDIHIPSGIRIDYNMADDNRARIENGRMIGYFSGEVIGIPSDQEIQNYTYKDNGDLGLTSPEPFEYQISTRVINNIFEVILGKNRIHMDLTNEFLESVDFPIRWDSTNLENAVPDLTDYIGYDVPLSARIRNMGAPRFIFNRHEMIIVYSMAVEVWDEHFDNWVVTIEYHDIQIDFEMWLEGYNVTTWWNEIKMDKATIHSDVVKNLQTTHADRLVTWYFNNMFQMILPWANKHKPYGVSSFVIPEYLVDLVHIRDLKMAVRDNYFSFTMDPEFIMKATQAERRQNLYVLASHGPNFWQNALNILSALLGQ